MKVPQVQQPLFVGISDGWVFGFKASFPEGFFCTGTGHPVFTQSPLKVLVTLGRLTTWRNVDP